jgi:octopine/nopaline transport system substrate-binding protein
MKFLRVFTLAIVGGVVASTGALAQDKTWETVRIASEGAYAPWNFTSPDGKLIGYEIDLAHELCKRMRVKCEIVAQDWDGMLPALNAGKFDAIMASMAVTPDREKVATFSAPYTKSPNGFMALQGTPVAEALGSGTAFNLRKDPQGAEAGVKAMAPVLKGKVLGVQGSTTAALFADAYLKNVMTVREYKTVDQHNLDLVAGRIDLVMANTTVLSKELQRPELKGAKLVGPTFIEGVLGSGTANVAMRKGDAGLKALFDKAIAEVNADGTNKKLTEQWFGLDITPKD